MQITPLQHLAEFGQSPWLDTIDRELVRGGRLAELIRDWGIRGVTSNPAIFEQAITRHESYRSDLIELARAGRDVNATYDALVIDDVRAAADLLAPVYRETAGRDGFVSLEVSPHLVHKAADTVAEATRLWRLLDRPNVMIKVPATTAGLAAIRQLLGAGLNINVTLLFSLERYRQAGEAYLGGLEDAIAAGRSIDTIASVASFFLSRIDAAIDPELRRIAESGRPCAMDAKALLGTAAIASARCAYGEFAALSQSSRFRNLTARGARPQRLLWASTGTKDPGYSDIKYVEPLIGRDTVNTMPMATLVAYQNHGKPVPSLHADDGGARTLLAGLEDVGIDLQEVTDRLLTQGILSFVDAYDASHRWLQQDRDRDG